MGLLTIRNKFLDYIKCQPINLLKSIAIGTQTLSEELSTTMNLNIIHLTTIKVTKMTLKKGPFAIKHLKARLVLDRAKLAGIINF